MTEKLLPCPFCGKQVALIDNCHELEDCENFERCEATGYYAVVCDVNEGGCGASGGYARTEQEAISAWNRRTQPENKPLTCEGCIDSKSGDTCGSVTCIRNRWLGLMDHYRYKPEEARNER